MKATMGVPVPGWTATASPGSLYINTVSSRFGKLFLDRQYRLWGPMEPPTARLPTWGTGVSSWGHRRMWTKNCVPR